MLNRFKNVMKIVRDEFTVTAGRMMTGDVTVFSKTERVIITVAGLILGLILTAASTQVYAGGDIVQQAENMAKSYYKDLFAIVFVAAALFLLIAVLWAMISPTSQGARKPIEWGVRIVIALIVASAIGGITNLVKTLTNGLNFTP